MQSHYEINIAVNGRHLFATAPRSLTSKEDAQVVAKLLAEKFPYNEGYTVSITHWAVTGTSVKF